MTSSVAPMLKKYLIVMILLTVPVCFSEGYCAKRYINGQWETFGNCPDVSIADIMAQLKPEMECRSDMLIDLIFVIDGSGSINQENFDLILRWIQNVSMGFNISGPVKIGVVQYSSWDKSNALDEQTFIKTEISLGNYTNITEFNAAVNAIQHHGLSTYTAHAINKTVMYDFDSNAGGRYPDAGRIMILVTDGMSADPTDLPYSAKFASDQGVVSYAVGVRFYDIKELRTIAGDDKRVFEVAKFDALDEIVNELQQSISQSLGGC